jgi:hypothetical protein
MALTKCPNCRNKVSTEASACPQCEEDLTRSIQENDSADNGEGSHNVEKTPDTIERLPDGGDEKVDLFLSLTSEARDLLSRDMDRLEPSQELKSILSKLKTIRDAYSNEHSSDASYNENINTMERRLEEVEGEFNEIEFFHKAMLYGLIGVALLVSFVIFLFVLIQRLF